LVLKTWDKQTNAESRGAILFAHRFDLLGENIFPQSWNAQQPVTTPGGLKNPKKAVEVLSKAVAR
jgi:acyl-homoserine-lactone acylase